MNGICLRAVEFRAEEVGDGRTLSGYAAVFNSPARIRSWEGEFDEEIMPGAFRSTMKKRKPVIQYDHGRDVRVGSVPIAALEELREDEQGLYVRARLFDNDVIEPVRQAIAGKAINGMSFRFEVTREQWTDANGKKVRDDELPRLLWEPGERGPLKRQIFEVDPLHELGPVVFPAYVSTSVGVRSLLAQVNPDERADLVRELAAELRRIPDLTDTGAEPAGDPSGDRPGNGTEPTITRSRVDTDALRLRGIIL